MSKYLLLLTLTKEKQIKIRYQLRKNNTNGVAKSLHFQFFCIQFVTHLKHQLWEGVNYLYLLNLVQSIICVLNL